MLHRKHVDSSIDIIGLFLFGQDEGPSILETVRGRGLPLADDWDCLKSNVSFRIRLLLMSSSIALSKHLLIQISNADWPIRFDCLRHIVAHWLNMGWNTCGRLRISAIRGSHGPEWRKLVWSRVVGVILRNGVLLTKVTVLNGVKFYASCLFAQWSKLLLLDVYLLYKEWKVDAYLYL